MRPQRRSKKISEIVMGCLLTCLAFWGLALAQEQTFISGKVITADGKVVASGVVALE